MPFPRIVPSALWLVLHLTAGPCRRGAASAGRAARGATEVCAKGTMTASPCCAIPAGTNVTLSCQLAAPRARGWCRAAIFLNSSEQSRAQGGSVSKTLLVTAQGRHYFTCKCIGGGRTALICGIDIHCGNPPDEPRNVSCIQKGTQGRPTCTWHKGRLTYLPTAYGIQLSNGTNTFSFPEEAPSQVLFGSGALSRLDFGSNYSLVVSASNPLGNASSQPLTFTLIDIVKPLPPEFSVEFDDSSGTSCTIVWHHEAQAQHCRLRHRPLGRHGWSTVESLSRERFHLQGLEPDTAHEFQVSCRMLPGRGLWSDWSSSQGSTPAAVPTGTLDVWYRQQELHSGLQNLSFFWKALSRWEAGGRILCYNVTLEALEQGKLPAQSHRTTRTSFSRVTPRAGHRVTVTAQSPRGSSAPATVLTHLGSPDLPPPQRVSAVGLGNSNILVSWSPPARAALPLGGYLVEWAEPWREPQLQPLHSWVKLPPSHLSTVIAEHIRDNVCYQIHVSALYQDRAGQAASVRGNSTAQGKPQECCPGVCKAFQPSSNTTPVPCSPLSWAPDVHHPLGQRSPGFLGGDPSAPAEGLHHWVPHLPAQEGWTGPARGPRRSRRGSSLPAPPSPGAGRAPRALDDSGDRGRGGAPGQQRQRLPGRCWGLADSGAHLQLLHPLSLPLLCASSKESAAVAPVPPAAAVAQQSHSRPCQRHVGQELSGCQGGAERSLQPLPARRRLRGARSEPGGGDPCAGRAPQGRGQGGGGQRWQQGARRVGSGELGGGAAAAGAVPAAAAGGHGAPRARVHLQPRQPGPGAGPRARAQPPARVPNLGVRARRPLLPGEPDSGPSETQLLTEGGRGRCEPGKNSGTLEDFHGSPAGILALYKAFRCVLMGAQPGFW
ncbi:interleukin-12 receptor subunit beta-2 isoform X1 [Zonotrichia albicollis]|uniref:interleukin-12 receptor subunit beta-2 isoform X1 n=1 Tax=Zonotrichia albicollis TaxID=44394 RepID=UPI003D80F9FD